MEPLKGDEIEIIQGALGSCEFSIAQALRKMDEAFSEARETKIKIPDTYLGLIEEILIDANCALAKALAHFLRIRQTRE